MQNCTFKIEASFSFLKSFDTTKFFGLFGQNYKLDLPALPKQALSSEAEFYQPNKSIALISVDIAFLHTAKGKEFLIAYLAELARLKPEPRKKLVAEASSHLFSYSLNVIIENKNSHKNPITLDAFDLHGTKELMHTVQALKQHLASGKPLILNNDDDDSFTEEYVYIADYWAVNNGAMEFHYQDFDAENDDEAVKVHKSTIDSASFINQFSRTAQDINDLLKKVANTLEVDLNSLD